MAASDRIGRRASRSFLSERVARMSDSSHRSRTLTAASAEFPMAAFKALCIDIVQ